MENYYIYFIFAAPLIILTARGKIFQYFLKSNKFDRKYISSKFIEISYCTIFISIIIPIIIIRKNIIREELIFYAAALGFCISMFLFILGVKREYENNFKNVVFFKNSI